MSSIRTTYDALMDLVTGLTTSYVSPEGKMLPHRRSLMSYLVELSMPSQSLVTDPNAPSTPPRRLGSPAPWAAAPAELLEEIQSGAVDLVVTARRVLGLPPAVVPVKGTENGREMTRHVPLDRAIVRHGPKARRFSGLSLEQAGPAALRMLPELHRRIRSRPDLADHWLVRVELADGTLDAGEIEKRLRTWHHRAAVIAGHEGRPLPVGQVPNPWHPDNIDNLNAPPTAASAWWRGPTCEARSSSCSHGSCMDIRWSRRERWVEAICPWCSRASLLQEPATGAVYCGRPSCRDSAGRRPRWTVEELRRLGSLVASEVRSA